jgi:cation transport ATPase
MRQRLQPHVSVWRWESRGTDAALEAADVALLSDDLRKLVYAYTLSRRANRIIKQNLYLCLRDYGSHGRDYDRLR